MQGMRHVILFLLVAAGCGTTRVDSVESSVESDAPTRRIKLQREDKIAVKADASGATTVTVTIAGPGINTGHYTTTAEALLPAARDAVETINNPGTTIWIRVDEHDHIVAIGREQVR
jgi:hypothetical protein